MPVHEHRSRELDLPALRLLSGVDGYPGDFLLACDQLGVHWTKSGERTIYVFRKADVAKLDTFIGPKR